MQTSKIKKTDPDKRLRNVLSAGTLAANSVRNAAGEDLGKFGEIMITFPKDESLTPCSRSADFSDWETNCSQFRRAR